MCNNHKHDTIANNTHVKALIIPMIMVAESKFLSSDPARVEIQALDVSKFEELFEGLREMSGSPPPLPHTNPP